MCLEDDSSAADPASAPMSPVTPDSVLPLSFFPPASMDAGTPCKAAITYRNDGTPAAVADGHGSCTLLQLATASAAKATSPLAVPAEQQSGQLGTTPLKNTTEQPNLQDQINKWTAFYPVIAAAPEASVSAAASAVSKAMPNPLLSSPTDFWDRDEPFCLKIDYERRALEQPERPMHPQARLPTAQRPPADVGLLSPWGALRTPVRMLVGHCL